MAHGVVGLEPELADVAVVLAVVRMLLAALPQTAPGRSRYLRFRGSPCSDDLYLRARLTLLKCLTAAGADP